MQKSLTPYKNILIIKPGAVGDLLQMTPVIRALKAYSPDTKISMLVGSEITAALFRNDPRISETVIFERDGRHRSLSSRLALWKHLHKQGYDLVLNCQRSNLKTWFLASAAFPCRVLVYHKAKNRTVHAVVNYLETLMPLGITPADLDLELVLDDGARAYARELFSSLGLEGKTVIALNPGATHAVNRWPISRFAGLADRITEQMHACPLIIGGPDDIPLADEIVARSRTKPVSIAGRTSLLQLGAVLERCVLLVSGDTGPLHLATAVGTKAIGLFGAADPARTGPVGKGHRVIQAAGVACVPCKSRRCSNQRYLECMESITVRDVADVAAGMLG
ncbi:MAG: glycosyltransferase family 9 protein [Nitrospirota bacterium]